MLAIIRNYGATTPISVKMGDVKIPGDGMESRWDDQELIDKIQEMKGRNELPLMELTIEEGEAVIKTPTIDYSKYRINELRSIAGNLGIPGFFTAKKADLIKQLEEQNGTTN